MILIIGGVASGKRTYAREVLGYQDSDMADACLNERRVVFNAQKLAVGEEEALQKLIDALSEKDVVIANEVGLGIIPMERRDREMREYAGRMTNRLAQRAEKVIRMVCGIAQVLKG